MMSSNVPSVRHHISYLMVYAISAHFWMGSKLSVSPLDCIEAFESHSIPWITIYFPFSAPAALYFAPTTSFSFLEMDTFNGGTGCRGTFRAGLPNHSTICWYLNQTLMHENFQAYTNHGLGATSNFCSSNLHVVSSF